MLTVMIICAVLACVLGLGTGLVACCAGITHRRMESQPCFSTLERHLSAAASS